MNGIDITNLNFKSLLDTNGFLKVDLRSTTITGVENDHDRLDNLDYDVSGHTGFASSAMLSTASGILNDKIDTTSGTLQDAIDDIVVGAVSWEAIQNKPSTFTPSVHGDEAHSLDYALYSELTSVSGVLQDEIDNIDLSAYATTIYVDTVSGSLQDQIDNLTPDHASLTNLDYASSGHTGFAPAGDYATNSGVNTISGSIVDQIPTDYISDSEITTISGNIVSQIITDHGGLTGLSDNDHPQYDFSTASGILNSKIDTTSGTLQSEIDQINASAAGVIFWMIDEDDVEYPTYEIMRTTPATGAEDTDAVVVNNGTGEVLIGQYITASGTSTGLVIPAGHWDARVFADVDSSTGVTQIVVRVYKKASGGTETELFNMTSAEINNTSVAEVTIQSYQADFTLDSTDRLVIKFYGKTTSVTDRTITYYYQGTTHYTHIHTPTQAIIISDHGALQGLLDDDHTQYLNTTRGDARYYTEGEVDTISGAIVAQIPSLTGYATESYVDTVSGALNTKISTKITASDVTFENLNANGDVGSGATQVSIGTHSHDYATTVHVHSGIISDIGNSPLGQKIEAFCYDTGDNPNDAHFAVRIDGINMLSVYNYSSVGVKFRDGEYIVGFENTITGTRSNVVPTEQAVVTYVGTNTHTRSHAITSTSDHTAGNHKVFYSNSSGQVVELALGASGTVLTSAGASSAPVFSTAAGTSTFLGLTDTPAAYTSQAGKFVRVNGGETALEFTDSSATDDAAIHDDTSGEINAITEKTTPVAADLLLIEDSAASNAKKKLQIGNLPISLSKDTSPTLSGNLTLNNKSIVMTAEPSVDGTAVGDIAVFTAGETVSFREVCYIGADGKMYKADADASTTMPAVAMATATISGNATGNFLLRGFVRYDTDSWTVGTTSGIIYVSTTAGALTQTTPAGTTDQVQIVGFATHADRMFFNPNYALAEVK